MAGDRSVIFNSSPLINLARIGRLDLIKAIYRCVIIPEAVYNEVVIAGLDFARDGASEVERLIVEDVIEVKEVENRNLVKAFNFELDYGESEVLALAIEIEADLVILDEAEARRVADKFDIDKTGFIGILIKADKLGLIESGRELLDDVIAKGFRIDEALYKRVVEILE